MSSRTPNQDIKDYDIFHFDAELSEDGEAQIQMHVDSVLSDLGVEIEVADQARVHLWYPYFFGRPYHPHSSAEDGTARLLVMETCVGVRPGECHAPYGLGGVYAGTLTSNPLVPHACLFARKTASCRQRLDCLTVCQGSAEHGA